jgi:hypothetical protein
VLETAAGRWKGLPVYVACSGNFTVERVLARCGVGAIHSNDIEPYLDFGPATIATSLLAGEMLKVGSDNAYIPSISSNLSTRSNYWPMWSLWTGLCGHAGVLPNTPIAPDCSTT